MKTIFVAVRIWAKTILFGGFFCGLGWLLANDVEMAFISTCVQLVGYVVTLPLLLLITPLVKLSTHLPYANHAKTAWLTFYLAILIIIFCRSCSILFTETSNNLQWNCVMVSCIAGLLIAVRTTRKSLLKIYTTSVEIKTII